MLVYFKCFVCRTYCASKTDDLAAVIDHIKAKNPNAALMALGVSLGNLFVF
jgi:predicted alpha/beta-fold hydrolase